MKQALTLHAAYSCSGAGASTGFAALAVGMADSPRSLFRPPCSPPPPRWRGGELS